MKKIILATLVAFMVTGVQAQIVSSKNSRLTVEKQAKVKPEIANYNRFSLGLSTNKFKTSDDNLFKFKIDGKREESMTLKGLDINYMRGISLTQKFPLYLEVGGRLTYETLKSTNKDGGNNWSEKETERFNLLSLSVPVNVTYKYTFSNGFYLAPFVGIHFRLNLMANDKWEYEETYYGETEKEDGKMSFFKADEEDEDAYFDEDMDVCKRFQFGGQVGLNFGYKALNIGLGYYFDTPFYKYDSDTNSSNDFKIKSGGVALTVGVNF